MSKNRKILIAVIAAAAALILGGAYLLYQRYYGGAAKFDIESYPIVSYEYRKTASEHGIVADYLWMRTKELMLGKDGDSLFIPSSYMIAGRLSYQDAESSGEYLLSDQSLLLAMYVRRGDRLSAMRLKDAILNSFDLESESNSELASFLEAYLYYYTAYGSVNDGDRIREITGILFDEEGSMRMVSVGIDILELSDDPKMLVLGQTSPTVTKSKLYEVSCVDIGANDDALRLSRDGNHLTLGKDSKNPLPLLTNKTKEKSMEQKKLALLLGLPEDASEKQILAKIQSLLSLAEELNTLKKEKEELTLSAITSSVEDAVKDRRLSADRKGQFIELGKKIGVAELKKVLQAMNPAVKPSQMLGGVSDGAWKKLSDVPADQLEAMKENDPAQYCRLFKAEYGFECEI